MIIAVDDTTNEVKYATWSVVLSDGKPATSGTSMYLADKVPSDLEPDKYLYVNGTFELNPNFTK